MLWLLLWKRSNGGTIQQRDAAKDEHYFGDVCQCLTDFQTNSIIERYAGLQ